jgi:hypothetical protein
MVFQMNQREIKRIFDYDALTGCLYWKDVKFKSSHNAIKFDGGGNRIVQYDGKVYVAARLIWTLHYGTELTRKDYLGYVDGNRNNTKIENLFLKDGITIKSVYRDIKPRVSAEKIVYDFAMNHKGATISKTFRTLTEALEYRTIVRNHLGASFIGMDA